MTIPPLRPIQEKLLLICLTISTPHYSWQPQTQKDLDVLQLGRAKMRLKQKQIWLRNLQHPLSILIPEQLSKKISLLRNKVNKHHPNKEGIKLHKGGASINILKSMLSGCAIVAITHMENP